MGRAVSAAVLDDRRLLRSPLGRVDVKGLNDLVFVYFGSILLLLALLVVTLGSPAATAAKEEIDAYLDFSFLDVADASSNGGHSYRLVIWPHPPPG